MSSHNMLDFQDGLPKQFVASLKILFDILDEEHTGLIHLRDIESRWSDEGVKDLPSGVMEGLRKVVPPSGFLTFDIFVSGLKLALFQTGQDQLKRRSVSGSALTQKENRSPAGTVPFSGSSRLAHSSPNPPLQSSPGNRQAGSSPTDNNKATGKPSPRSAIPQLQQKSPQHDSRPATAAVKPQPSSTNSRHAPSYPPPPSSSVDHPHPNYPIPSRLGPPPPRPERSLNPQIRKPAPDVNPPQVPPRDQRQNQKITSDPTSTSSRGKQEEATSQAAGAPQQQQQGPGKATVRRHGSGRRHTLQNGVDQNMIKRMQQLEEEGAMLKRGLEMVDMARDWYLRQLSALQDKQRMLGKVSFNDNSLEAHQERMNFQRARISEVNMQLRTLVDSSEKGFPLHMNLAVTPSKDSTDSSTVTLVKDHNRRLTQELGDKKDKISKLEQEKASLIRELFESRSKHKSSYDDTTFM